VNGSAVPFTTVDKLVTARAANNGAVGASLNNEEGSKTHISAETQTTNLHPFTLCTHNTARTAASNVSQHAVENARTL
jgi:hypothetical protein